MKVTMTPKRARQLLLLNTKNRKVSRGLVAKYASDMKAGRWPYNGDPIRVSATNVLLDGQHRLQACVDADVPFDCELIEGLPDEVGKTIDGGRKRSAADVLGILNGTSMTTTGIAASARQILNYCGGVSPFTPQSTPAIVDIVEEHPAIAESHIQGRTVEKIIPPAALGAILFLGTRAVGMDKRAAQFIDPILHGEGMNIGDPRLALRNAFLAARVGRKNKGMNMSWTLVGIAQAWNAFATGRELQIIKVAPDREGRITCPNIIGGPNFGAGVEALKQVRMHTNQKKIVDAAAAQAAS